MLMQSFMRETCRRKYVVHSCRVGCCCRKIRSCFDDWARWSMSVVNRALLLPRANHLHRYSTQPFLDQSAFLSHWGHLFNFLAGSYWRNCLQTAGICGKLLFYSLFVICRHIWIFITYHRNCLANVMPRGVTWFEYPAVYTQRKSRLS